jgi:hypothetical protein
MGTDATFFQARHMVAGAGNATRSEKRANKWAEVLVSRDTKSDLLPHTATYSPGVGLPRRHWLDKSTRRMYQHWMDGGPSIILSHNWKLEVRFMVDSSSHKKIVGCGMGSVGTMKRIST